MASDDDFTFDDDEVDTSLEQKPYDDRTAFGTSFDEQLALREAQEREAEEQRRAMESGPKAPPRPPAVHAFAPPAKGMAYDETALGPSFDERISQMGERIARLESDPPRIEPPSDTPLAGVPRPFTPGGAAAPAQRFPQAQPLGSAPPRPLAPAPQPPTPAPFAPRPFAQQSPFAPGQDFVPEPDSFEEESGGGLPKTVVLSAEEWGLAAAPQPFAPQPFAPQPFAPQPFAPQPHAPQPHAPQPNAPNATAAPPKKKSNLVVFIVSAVAVFFASGICVGGGVLYLLFNR